MYLSRWSPPFLLLRCGEEVSELPSWPQAFSLPVLSCEELGTTVVQHYSWIRSKPHSLARDVVVPLVE